MGFLEEFFSAKFIKIRFILYFWGIKMNKSTKIGYITMCNIAGALIFFGAYYQPKFILPKARHDEYLVQQIKKRIDRDNDGVLQVTEIADLLKKDFEYEEKINQNGIFKFEVSNGPEPKVEEIYSEIFGRNYQHTLVSLPRKTVEELVK